MKKDGEQRAAQRSANLRFCLSPRHVGRRIWHEGWSTSSEATTRDASRE